MPCIYEATINHPSIPPWPTDAGNKCGRVSIDKCGLCQHNRWTMTKANSYPGEYRRELLPECSRECSGDARPWMTPKRLTTVIEWRAPRTSYLQMAGLLPRSNKTQGLGLKATFCPSDSKSTHCAKVNYQAV